ncbi:MAG: DUF1189 family protein [Elusimicrobia bacterium]|nr:DUF1189 family protein [Elusimicrobiota bacterium]
MRKYGVMHPIVLSFFSKDFYRDVAKNWGFASFVYLLIFVILCSIPIIIKIDSGLRKAVEIGVKEIVSQFPAVTIKNGELSINKPSPYFIKAPDTSRRIIAFATEGEFSSPEEAKSMILVTKTSVIMEQNSRETRAYDLSEIQKEFSFDKEDIRKWAGYIKYLIYIVTPLLWIWVYIVRILQALLLAIVGLIFAKILKSGLTYGKLILLAIMANTPGIVVKTLLSSVGASIQLWWLMGLIISCGFMFFAVRSNIEPDTPPPGPSGPEPNVVS